MWIYKSSTGDLSTTPLDYDSYQKALETGGLFNCNHVSTGYSGCDDHPPITGRNNPGAEDVQNIGPIPRGLYYIGPFNDSPRLGPLVASLVPDASTNTFGRSGFYLHGDNIHHDASHGCIIMDHRTREMVDLSDDKVLLVVA